MCDQAGKIAAVGMFDGVHRGHRFVVDRLVERGKELGLSPMIVTFRNHPLSVIKPAAAPLLLTSPAKKEALLRSAGVETLWMPDFSPELRRLTAEQFMTLLRDKFNVRRMLVGYDHKFGSDALRTPEAFRAAGKRAGVEVEILPELPCSGLKISSTAVRNAIASGDIAAANSLLGHPFALEGTIVEGQQIGRTIGFPTANLRVENGYITPGGGVYAAKASLADGSEFPAMVNIGRRPTVDTPNAPTTIEAHILDFSGNLYGQPLTLDFAARLRNEKRFSSLAELQSAIAADAAAARKVLSEMP